MKKSLSLVAAAALVLALPLISQAAVIGNLNLSSSAISQSGSFNLSGTCGNAGANGSVSFQLSNNGINTSVGNAVSTNSSGQFNATLTIPSNYNTGISTVIATCPNGDTVTAPVIVTAPGTNPVPIGNTLTLSGNPTLGQSLTVSGVCGTTNAGGNVTLRFVRAVGATVLGSTTTTGNSGNFTGTFTVPNNSGAGPVSLVAICPTGTITFNTAIVDPLANMTVSDSSLAAGESLTVNGVCGTTAGGTVSFLLSNPTSQTTLGTTTTTANGNFSTTLTIPGSFAAGSATLVTFCPTGNIVTANLTIETADARGGTGENGNGTGTGTDEDEDSTPVGGVAAGAQIPLSIMLALGLVTAGVAGMVASKRMENSRKDV